ncbi:hypothetical protein ACFWGN_20720 [Oerskovia sp. NPDC060338]|uniref:hypothetical protein n=1 Tax=Oerskovia sp. NPDC060338 TaxID=3347100 RepID=UPI003653F80D
MVDVFRESVSVKFPKNAPTWKSFDVTSARMVKALRGLPGKVKVDDVTIRATTGTEIERKTAREGDKFLREHDLKVREFTQFIISSPNGEVPIRWNEVDARVAISTMLYSPGSVEISISATSKVTCDGLAAAARSFAKKVAEDPQGILSASPPSGSDNSSARTATIESVSLGGVTIAAATGTTPSASPAAATSPAAAANETDASLPKWKRFWEKYLTGILITVVGTVVAAFIVAWLKIA